MIYGPDTLPSCIDAAGSVVDDRIVRPTIPQLFHDLHKFLAAIVAVTVAYLPGCSKVLCCRREPRGHDVPCRATVADVVNRSKLACEVEGLGIRRGGGGD